MLTLVRRKLQALWT